MTVLSSMRLMPALVLLVGCPGDKPTDLVDTGAALLVEDADGDGYDADEDCDDNNSVVSPAAEEICDGVDNNCDGQIDEGVTSEWYADTDDDGFGDPDSTTWSCSPPEGYAATGTDCNDADSESYPGAPERCDGVDNNCDGQIDENVTTVFYADTDGDGFGDPAAAVEDCDPEPGYVADGTDCDDTDPLSFPDAEEVCDEADNDCDTLVDEDVTTTYYQDTDKDRYGVADETTEACSAPTGYSETPGDCDDADSAINPDAQEVCDSADNDCDTLVDDDDDSLDASGGGTWYADDDGDSYGDPNDSTDACLQPSGTVSDDTDCDDANNTINPAASEVCDEVDNDCDTLVDDDDGSLDTSTGDTYYTDGDGDGYGDPDDSTDACDQPSGTVSDDNDCDDTDSAISPSASEVCDEVDNDCDGDTDDADSSLDTSTGETFYTDDDGDGFGDASDSTDACDQPSGAVSDDTDCDDTDSSVNPDATEVCNEVDDDCDGDIDDDDSDLADSVATYYTDDDGDGYGDPDDSTDACAQPSGSVSDNTDCDDTDSSVNPGETEICSGVDDDCDGVVDDLGPSAVYAGSLVAGAEKRYQYSPVTSGSGYIEANWASDAAAGSYELAVGTSAGDDDVEAWTDVGAVTSTTLTGLTLEGAWDDVAYYVSIRAVNGSTSCDLSATSAAVQIAEAETWTGDVTDLRSPDSRGGYTQSWPESGVDAVYGEHWFEEVDIASGDEVLVQGWGAEDGVSAGIASSASAVTDPSDGWLSLYANDITVAGMITASGRGYGGGAGGGAGIYGGEQGEGGDSGLGGDGGAASTSYAGGGGGGSPGGVGGTGANTGGDGNLYGGGSGATGCSGSDGRDGGDGAVSTVGGTGATASSGSPGDGGDGEFDYGGGDGVSGCDNWSGGGGGGYGAGGGGGAQWASRTAEAAGGGGGGAGGDGGSRTVNGAAAAGVYAGSGGTNTGSRTGTVGTDGGYLASASNGDTSTDRSLELGSGGGGGSGGYQETGGGGGGAGGGAIYLYAYDSITLESTAYLLANGAGGGGGARDNGGASTSAAGGVGAGGGLLLEAQDLTISVAHPYISATGGDGQTSNGGTIKLFYDSFSGTTPSSSAAGRVYDAGSGSWDAP